MRKTTKRSTKDGGRRRSGPSVIPGTLEMLILKAVSGTPRHGSSIVQWIDCGSGFELRIDDGSLYPALRRLERRGHLTARWGRSQRNRRAKYYRITVAGKRALESKLSDWSAFSAAIATTIARSALEAARRRRKRCRSRG